MHRRAAGLIQAWKHFCTCADTEDQDTLEAMVSVDAAIMRASRRFDRLVMRAATAPHFDEVMQAVQKMAANPGRLTLDAHGTGNLLGAASNAHADVVYRDVATGQQLRSILVAVPIWGEPAAHNVAARATAALQASGWVSEGSRIRCLGALSPRRMLELAQDPARTWAVARAAATREDALLKALLSPCTPPAAGTGVRALLISVIAPGDAALAVVDAVPEQAEDEAASRWASAVQDCMEDAGVEDVVVCQPASLDEAAMVGLAIDAVAALATAASNHSDQVFQDALESARALQETALVPAPDGVTLAARLDDGTELVLHAVLPPEATVWMAEIATCMDLATPPALVPSLAALPWRLAPRAARPRLH